MADKIKKLSEAIRLGATFREQCKGTPFNTDADGVTRSCAIGAAYEALTGKTMNNNEFEAAYNILVERFNMNAHEVKHIWRMNDSGKSREQIADILAAEGK